MSELDKALRAAGIRPDGSIPAEDGDRGVRFYGVPGMAALLAWRSLRAAADATGSWPLLVGDRDSLQNHREVMADEASGTPAELLAGAEEVDAEAFFRRRIHEIEANGSLPRGAWPSSVEPASDLSIHLDVLSRKPLREVIVALVPVALPWQAFAFIPYGGWNECPFPVEQLAVHRYWHEHYGAELAAVSTDTVELYVRKPPATPADASALAVQHYAYCSDVVDQGTETIHALAGGLLNAGAWYFWWD